MRIFFLLSFCCFAQLIYGQEEPSENKALITLQGHITDEISKKDLETATVELLNFIPRKIVQTNQLGEFQLPAVPLGRHKLLIKKDGYDNKVVSDIILTVDNSQFLQIELRSNGQTSNDQSQSSGKTEILYSKNDKDQPNNPMSAISAQPFTVEEVARYAGARLDLGRLTNNYAGVTNNYDGRNDIVVRGISPAYTTWQVEELPVESPNHFGVMGSSGGTTSLINIFALGKADFMKGCFAPQYGNAMAGVFDVALRKGNSKTFQTMGMLSSQRGELLIEGPFSKRLRGSSYLLSVRHSTGNYLFNSIANQFKENNQLYLTIRDWADPRHSDFNLKVDFGKMGRHNLEFFALGGNMRLFIPHNNRLLRDEVRYIMFEDEQLTFITNLVLAGFKHTYRPNNQLFFRNVVGASYQQQRAIWVYNQPDPNTGETADQFTTYASNGIRFNYLWHSYMQHKSKNTQFRAGFVSNIYQMSILGNYLLFNYYDADFDSVFAINRVYAQHRWDISKKVSLHSGFSIQQGTLSSELVVDPRLTLRWDINPRHNISIAAAVCHQSQHLQSIIVLPYLGFDSLGNNIYDYGERYGKFLRSRQLNVEYNFLMATNWRLKLQAYYNLINKVRIHPYPSYYSGLNTNYSFFDTNFDPTVTQGKGRNMGLELSIEKFFTNGWYLLANGTIYDAKVLSGDSVWRNSIFNNRFIANLLVGREFNFGKFRQHVFFVDGRFATHGGRPYTPIDVEATYQQGLQNLGTEGVLVDSLYNAVFTPNFYQVDFKIGVRLNSLTKKISQTVRIDLFNVFNIHNIYDYRYSAAYDVSGQPVRGTVVPIFQRGFIPDLTYIIQF